MGKEEFPKSWLYKFLIKRGNETFREYQAFVSTFEVLKKYFKCSNVEYNAINPLDLLRDLFKI